MDEATFRLRVRYKKTGRLRFLSHLEVMRAIERAVRRAELPYAISQGFSPRMKAAFGPALSVGCAGEDEYFDVWLTAYLPAGEALSRLRDASAADLAPVAAGYVAKEEPSLSQALCIACTEVKLQPPASMVSGQYAEKLQTAIDAVCARGFLTVVKKDKTKRVELSKTLVRVPKAVASGSSCTIELWTRSGESGSLRADAFVSAVGEELGEQPYVIGMVRKSQFQEAAGKLEPAL